VLAELSVTSPYPVIPDRCSKSRTRRVPAPSHLAQRDVAKTHLLSRLASSVAPGAERTAELIAWRTCRSEEAKTANRQLEKYTRSRTFSQARDVPHGAAKVSIFNDLRLSNETTVEGCDEAYESKIMSRSQRRASDAHGHDDVAVAVGFVG